MIAVIVNQAGTGNVITIILAGAVIGYFIYNFIVTSRRLKRPASEKTIILSDNNFKETIKDGVSLVDFWAPWCQPCKVQGPIIDEVAEEVGDELNICKLNIDENKKTTSLFGSRSIPSIFIFKNGKIVERFTGIKNKKMLIAVLNKYQNL
ncbi:MAG: thioredoxin [Bacteroidales bacterium]|nr:thioredoxin [Bacteroidales bacterium]